MENLDETRGESGFWNVWTIIGWIWYLAGRSQEKVNK